MFEIKVEITWRMLQTEVSQTCYVGVPIHDENVDLKFGFMRINGINMLELYLNSRPRQRNSSSKELTRVLNNS
jgi:hypothetical protein